MPINDKLVDGRLTSTDDDQLRTSIIENVDKGYICATKEIPLNDKDILKENRTDHNIVLNGNFSTELKPGERLIIKKEIICDSIYKSYSLDTLDYNARINREVDLISDTQQSNCMSTDIIFEESNKEHLLFATHKIQQMVIVINSKDKEIQKLILDKKCMGGGIRMLKQNNLKLVPRSILVYMVVVSMMFCFFLTCFILDIFANVNIIHPFLSFMLTIGSLGLLLTARESIKDVKNTYLKNIKQ